MDGICYNLIIIFGHIWTHTHIYMVYIWYICAIFISTPEILIEISQNFSVLHDVQFFFRSYIRGPCGGM